MSIWGNRAPWRPKAGWTLSVYPYRVLPEFLFPKQEFPQRFFQYPDRVGSPRLNSFANVIAIVSYPLSAKVIGLWFLLWLIVIVTWQAEES